MRNCVWILSVALTISTSGFASAQQNQLSPFTASSFLTGVQQQDIVFQKVVDVPDFPNLQMQRTTTDRFSLRQMLSKVVPFLSPSAKPSYQTSVQQLPTSSTSSPLQPLLPQFGTPAGFGNSPLVPSLPRSSFPTIPDNSVLRPAQPIQR